MTVRLLLSGERKGFFPCQLLFCCRKDWEDWQSTKKVLSFYPLWKMFVKHSYPDKWKWLSCVPRQRRSKHQSWEKGVKLEHRLNWLEICGLFHQAVLSYWNRTPQVHRKSEFECFCSKIPLMCSSVLLGNFWHKNIQLSVLNRLFIWRERWNKYVRLSNVEIWNARFCLAQTEMFWVLSFVLFCLA